MAHTVRFGAQVVKGKHACHIAYPSLADLEAASAGVCAAASSAAAAGQVNPRDMDEVTAAALREVQKMTRMRNAVNKDMPSMPDWKLHTPVPLQSVQPPKHVMTHAADFPLKLGLGQDGRAAGWQGVARVHADTRRTKAAPAGPKATLLTTAVKTLSDCAERSSNADTMAYKDWRWTGVRPDAPHRDTAVFDGHSHIRQDDQQAACPPGLYDRAGGTHAATTGHDAEHASTAAKQRHGAHEHLGAGVADARGQLAGRRGEKLQTPDDLSVQTHLQTWGTPASSGRLWTADGRPCTAQDWQQSQQQTEEQQRQQQHVLAGAFQLRSCNASSQLGMRLPTIR